MTSSRRALKTLLVTSDELEDFRPPVREGHSVRAKKVSNTEFSLSKSSYSPIPQKKPKFKKKDFIIRNSSMGNSNFFNQSQVTKVLVFIFFHKLLD